MPFQNLEKKIPHPQPASKQEADFEQPERGVWGEFFLFLVC
jgi:hypothetical protein